MRNLINTIYLLCRSWIFDKKRSGCKNNHEKLSTANLSDNMPLCFLMFTISLFKNIENKHDTKVTIAWK